MTYTRCWIPKGGYPTNDGYLRVLNYPRRLGGKLKMWHRLVWEVVYGEIPDGYEVNHLCKVRQCCNPTHLEILTRSEHRTKDNTGRYQERRVRVFAMHMAYPYLTQREIADEFNMSQSSVSVILREMKEEYKNQTKSNQTKEKYL